MRVQVYRNLHKNCWSVRCKKTMKVIAHEDMVILTNCKFTVQQGGRRRVLETKTKKVHAFIEGDLTEEVSWNILKYGKYVSYNPYKYGHFYTIKGTLPVNTANEVLMLATGKVRYV